MDRCSLDYMGKSLMGLGWTYREAEQTIGFLQKRLDCGCSIDGATTALICEPRSGTEEEEKRLLDLAVYFAHSNPNARETGWFRKVPLQPQEWTESDVQHIAGIRVCMMGRSNQKVNWDLEKRRQDALEKPGTPCSPSARVGG